MVTFNVWYSTHSGTSERFAGILSEELEKRGHSLNLANMRNVQIADFKTKDPIILLVSTHYNGDTCTDAAHIYEWIKDEKPKEILKGGKFIIFGLGNTNFETFNRAALTYQKCF
jgi:sulfite reductase alpha subunit-like flavoprotein